MEDIFMERMQRILLCAGMIAAMALPAAAGGMSGDHAPVGGALAAKVIGETCPGALKQSELSEIDRYIDRVVAIEKAKGPDAKAFIEQLMPALDADYRSDRTCGIGDEELAKDMLIRIRKELDSESVR
jgi:hypothetical protein